MKKLTGLIIVLLVLILGGAYVTGRITEKSLNDTMSTMNNMDPQNGLTATLSNYKRGWFHSTAMLDWKLHVPEQTESTNNATTVTPASDFEFHLPITIYHGPVILADKTIKFGLGYASAVVKLPPEYEKQFKNIFTEASQEPELNLSIFINYFNKGEVNFTVPAFKAKTHDNVDFDWKGFSSTISASPDLTHIDGDLTLEGLDVTKGNKDKLVMGKFEIEYDLDTTPSTFYVGLTKIRFPTLKIDQAGKTYFALDDFNLRSDTSIDDNLFRASLESSLNKLDIEGKIYGPGQLDSSIKNLDADALSRVRLKIMELQKNNNSAQGQQIMMAILPELPQLLSHEPVLEISKLNFKMPQGTIEGKLYLSIPKSENLNPLSMMQNLKGSGSLSLPAEVLKMMLIQSHKEKTQASNPEIQNALVSEMQKDANAENAQEAQKPQLTVTPVVDENEAAKVADQQINKMLESGLIVKNNTNYNLEFKLENGKLTINNKSFTPNMLQF